MWESCDFSDRPFTLFNQHDQGLSHVIRRKAENGSMIFYHVFMMFYCHVDHVDGLSCMCVHECRNSHYAPVNWKGRYRSVPVGHRGMLVPTVLAFMFSGLTHKASSLICCVLICLQVSYQGQRGC